MGFLSTRPACMPRGSPRTGLPCACISTARSTENGGRGARWALAPLVLALALVGCSSSDDGPEPTPTGTSTPTTASPSPTETPTPGPEDLAGAAALETYEQYWDAVIEARSVPDPRSPELERYAGDTALANEQSFLLFLEEQGVRYEGEPTQDPEVVNVQLGEIPVVRIEDCIDSTEWLPVRIDTGESAAAPDQNLRVPNRATVERIGDQWLVTELEADRDRTC